MKWDWHEFVVNVITGLVSLIVSILAIIFAFFIMDKIFLPEVIIKQDSQSINKLHELEHKLNRIQSQQLRETINENGVIDSVKLKKYHETYGE